MDCIPHQLFKTLQHSQVELEEKADGQRASVFHNPSWWPGVKGQVRGQQVTGFVQ